MYAVLKREYLQAVRKKAFIIMTILLPFLLAAAMLLPSFMAARGMGSKKIAVLDGTGQLRDAFTKAPERPAPTDARKEAREAMAGRRSGPSIPSRMNIEYVDRDKATVPDAQAAYLERLRADDKSQQLDGVLVIPADAMDSEKAQLTYYGRSSTDIATQERLGRIANKVIQQHRLESNGISPADVARFTREVPVEGIQITKSGEEAKGGGISNLFFAFVFAALLMLPSFVYGNEVMRGIVQEKSDRVVEVLISSMTPQQLLTGKILGVSAVGLTQISVWLAMLAAIGIFGATTAAMAGVNVIQFLRPAVFVYFFIFFILAYLTYVCVYAIAGAVSNSEKEAQQFIAPISIVMMIPWFLMMPIIMSPDSPMSVGFSMAPVFGPVVIFVRALVSEPPLWHILVSIAVSIATILVFFWATAKIFRVGILSYGKRPTVPELLRWLRVA
ncbi:MAG: ABC transporter permease [Thermoanaerobaculia bacterium]